MQQEFENLPLVRNEISRQFELVVEGKKAFVEYEVREGKMFLTHAEVPVSLQGHGVDHALAEKILTYLEEQNLPLVPMCKFIKNYVQENPEWRRILAKGIQLGTRERF